MFFNSSILLCFAILFWKRSDIEGKNWDKKEETEIQNREMKKRRKKGESMYEILRKNLKT